MRRNDLRGGGTNSNDKEVLSLVALQTGKCGMLGRAGWIGLGAQGKGERSNG